MHLDRVRASGAKLSRNPPLIQEKVESYLFPGNYKSSPPPPKDHPRFPTDRVAVFRFQVESVSLQVFEGAESESAVHSAKILSVDLEPIGIHFFRNR